jgi:membrane protein DedA with SNARE-associated domain
MVPAGLIVFLTACLHEDVAILAAAYFVVEQGMSPALAASLAYAGMLANNLTLYTLGAHARRHAWIQRWLHGERAVRIRHRLERHLVTTLALSRLGQSMLTPALLGCGCLHVPLRRVMPVVAVTAAIYLAVMLTLAIVLGESVIQQVGNWVWIVPLVLVVSVGLLIARRRIARP